MDNPDPSSIPQANKPSASQFVDSLALDFKTIKIIAITVVVVFSAFVLPVLAGIGMVLTKVLDYGKIDDLFGISEKTRPGILSVVSETMRTGYSRTFQFDGQHLGADRANDQLEFYADPGPDQKQRASLWINTDVPLLVKVDNCNLGGDHTDFKVQAPIASTSDFDFTDAIAHCPGNLHIHVLTVRPQSLPKGSNRHVVTCVVVVSQKVHPHYNKQDQANAPVIEKSTTDTQ